MKLKDVDAWMKEHKQKIIDDWLAKGVLPKFDYIKDYDITDSLIEHIRNTYFTLGYYAAKVDEQQDKS